MNATTKHCKICFKEIKNDDLSHLFNKDLCICASCQNEFEPLFICFIVDGYNALAIYEYTPFIKKLIYQYKGCYDYELCVTFLSAFIKELSVRYKGHIVIPAPSYLEDNQKRGFNHVIEMFKNMNLPIYQIVEKTARHKQAEKNAKGRKEIGKFLKIKDGFNIKNKKVLIVDDIYTTGSTMRNIINLIEKLNPKTIKILVLAKTRPKTKTKN